MKIVTSISHNVFHIIPSLSFVSERNFQEGGLCYAYLSLSWGYWGIDVVFKEDEYEDDKDFFEYD